MSSMTGSPMSSPRSFAEAAGLEPLRAKSGWIIALGVVYVIAGLVAPKKLGVHLLGLIIFGERGFYQVRRICNSKQVAQNPSRSPHLTQLIPSTGGRT